MGKRAKVNVDVGCGFRTGDSESEEGLFAFIQIHEDSIGLSTLRTTYEKRLGSDHQADDLNFPHEFERWSEIFHRVEEEFAN